MSRASARRAEIRISGKQLGALALADACDRCMWLKLKLRYSLPYQIFPGVFSSIDSFSKNFIHAYLDTYGTLPAWLAALGDVVDYLPPPHWSRFQMLDDATGILLTGAPDGILVLRDGRLIVIDYKTARYTPHQDALHPMYAVQINVYAQIAEHIRLGKVAGAALLYMEPVTTGAPVDELARDEGVMMPFTAHIESVDLRREIIPPLLRRVRELSDLAAPPAGRADCKECALVARLLSHLR